MDSPAAEMLADGLNASGENIAACETLGVEFYPPLPGRHDGENPALRDDPSLPVAEEDRDRLPTTTRTVAGEKRTQLDKQAFVCDSDQDGYWCPQGQFLEYVHTTRETRRGRCRERRRYKSSPEVCEDCPLRSLCLQGEGKQRTISREQYESHRDRHAAKMSTPEAQEKYSRRFHAGERPFAQTKHHMGARRFATRGLDRVRQEWFWFCCAFNLHRLVGLIHSGLSPPD